MSKVFLTFWKISPKLLGLILMTTAGMIGLGLSPTVANEPPTNSKLSPSPINLNPPSEAAETANSATLELSELSETPPDDSIHSQSPANENLPVTSVTQLSVEAENSEANSMAQVTSVSQLSDVQPTDWAFQALQNLVERYGCIAGYPDGTFRGNRALTRYEFAAGLNACLDAITQLITEGGVP